MDSEKSTLTLNSDASRRVLGGHQTREMFAVTPLEETYQQLFSKSQLVTGKESEPLGTATGASYIMYLTGDNQVYKQVNPAELIKTFYALAPAINNLPSVCILKEGEDRNITGDNEVTVTVHPVMERQAADGVERMVTGINSNCTCSKQ